MKFPAIPLLSLPLLCSCLFQTHSKIYRLGCEYEGVSLLDAEHSYRINGRDYIKGQRTRLRQHYDKWWFAPCESVYYRPIEGTQGETVYREIKVDTDEAYPEGKWQTLDAAGARKQALSVPLNNVATHHPTRHRPVYTPWAIVTTPAAVASAVCVDIPVTLGFFAAFGVYGLYTLLPGQQQQIPPTADTAPNH